MSRRLNKKRLKKINPTQPAENTAQEENLPAQQAAASSDTRAAEYDMFIQYQNLEFDITDLTARILDKCSAENMEAADLKIYVKPEDQKAYYVCRGGNSSIDL